MKLVQTIIFTCFIFGISFSQQLSYVFSSNLYLECLNNCPELDTIELTSWLEFEEIEAERLPSNELFCRVDDETFDQRVIGLSSSFFSERIRLTDDLRPKEINKYFDGKHRYTELFYNKQDVVDSIVRISYNKLYKSTRHFIYEETSLSRKNIPSEILFQDNFRSMKSSIHSLGDTIIETLCTFEKGELKDRRVFYFVLDSTGAAELEINDLQKKRYYRNSYGQIVRTVVFENNYYEIEEFVWLGGLLSEKITYRRNSIDDRNNSLLVKNAQRIRTKFRYVQN